MKRGSASSMVDDYKIAAGDLWRSRRLGVLSAQAQIARARLRLGVGPRHILQYRLLEHPFDRWASFTERADNHEFSLIVNKETGGQFTRNKHAQNRRMAERGVPHAREIELTELAALGQTDLFLKPSDAGNGDGAFAARADEPGLAGRCHGMIINKRYRTHAGLQPIGGEYGLSTLRVHTVSTPAGGRVVAVVAKILAKPSLIDNFTMGTKGNLIASVDVDTGRLGKAYGLRTGNRHLVQEIERHPALGTGFEGFQLPDWPDLIRVARQCAEAFPEVPLLGNDIALTTEGPLVIEINTSPGYELPQIALGRGAREFLPEWLAMSTVDPERAQRGLAALNKRRARAA
jgi:Sugar-transfer associated ATP-grasp